MAIKRKTAASVSKSGKPAKSNGIICAECRKEKKGVSNRIVGRVIRPGQTPRELLVMRILCEPCLMLEDGKRKQ